MIFFDATEKMSAETEAWVWGDLLPCGLRRSHGTGEVRALRAGASRRSTAYCGGRSRIAELNPLSRDYILDYLHRRGVDEKDREGVADVMMLATEGNLFKLAALVDGYLKLRENRASVGAT